ncbi:MAG TPA: tetratricopeptide repeat protein, partial [Steroidobacteraceae bacterium]|nr:tetratricopeptide repeat protein [Steroidobacteraceae bacterium]
MIGMKKQGRNDPCACGSGKKYKNCCVLVPCPSHGESALEPSEASLLISLARSRRYADMEAKARELLSSHAACGFAWKALSVALEAQGKDALMALEKAAQLLPEDPEAHSNLGTALRRAGRLEEAEACYRRALGQNPRLAEVWSNLGNALRDSGRFDESVAAYRRSLELKPDFAKSHNNLGNALQDLGDLENAVRSYERALAIDPKYADAHCHMGMLRRMQGRWEEAEQSCHRALDLSPSCASALRLLGELRSDRGEFAASEELFRRALELEPDSAEALAGLVRFRKMGVGDGEWVERARGLLERGLG